MGRVAKQGERTRAPTVEAGEAVERPTAPGFRALDQGFRLARPRREARKQVRGVTRLAPALTARAARNDRDNVEVGAAADRIVNEMRARPDPEPDHRLGEAGGEARARDLRTPRRGTIKVQVSPRADAGAQRRPNAVGADQARAPGLAAVGGSRDDAIGLRVDRRNV